jgi:hypothetical protein
MILLSQQYSLWFKQAYYQLSELPKQGGDCLLFASRYLCLLRNNLAFLRFSAIKATMLSKAFLLLTLSYLSILYNKSINLMIKETGSI